MQDDALLPRLQHQVDRLARRQLEADRAGAALRLVPLQPGEDVVESFAAERHAPHRQAHGRLQHHEAAQPTLGQVDLLFAILGAALRLHLEAARIDQKAGLAVAAQLLEMLVERPGIIDVGGADADVGLGRKGAAVHAQAAVTAFVAAETLEEEHVVRHGNDRIAGHQQPPQFRIMLRQVVGVVLAR